MINLLQETEIAIEESGHTPEDIVFIGSMDSYTCTWEQYRHLADVQYDNDHNALKVASDLVIVFNDGPWLCRDEYLDSEGWKLITPPIPPNPSHPKPIHTLVCGDGLSWLSLSKLNSMKKSGNIYRTLFFSE